MVSKSYTKTDFQKDLQKLSKLMSKGGDSSDAELSVRSNNSSLTGGAKKRKSKAKKSKAVKKTVKRKSATKKRGGHRENSLRGGVKAETRRFKIVEVNGKAVTSTARVEVRKGGPISAARKLLTAHCREMKIKGNRRLGVHVTYTIQETTSGSKHKLYGPYRGHFKKYTPEELKNKVIGGIQRTIKAIVRPVKSSSNSKKLKRSASKKGGSHSMHHKKVSGGWDSNNYNSNEDEEEE